MTRSARYLVVAGVVVAVLGAGVEALVLLGLGLGPALVLAPVVEVLELLGAVLVLAALPLQLARPRKHWHCARCGSGLEGKTKYCPTCGALLAWKVRSALDPKEVAAKGGR